MGSLREPRGPVGSKESSPPMRRRRLSRRLLAQSSLQVLSISQVLHRVAFVKYERRKERSCEGEEAMMAGFNPRTKWARARTRRSRGAHCATRPPGAFCKRAIQTLPIRAPPFMARNRARTVREEAGKLHSFPSLSIGIQLLIHLPIYLLRRGKLVEVRAQQFGL